MTTKMSTFFFPSAFLCLYLMPCHLAARPLLSEEVDTVGRFSFESGFSLSQRNDAFGSPEIIYRTVDLPVQVRLGLHRFVDVGFTLTYISQRLETGDAHFSGSQTGLFSPLIKISPWKNTGLLTIWHQGKSERGEQNLPVARGNDFETVALFKLPTEWPINFNLGYLFRGHYESKLGISNVVPFQIKPGDIFETKTAVEIPLKFHLFLLTELAYYNVQKERIADADIPNSAGEALDALVGVTWAWNAWNMGFGTAFGLLDERHTSFNLERGAGDVLYKLTVSYKLTPRAPTR